jgi:hypothetical protein
VAAAEGCKAAWRQAAALDRRTLDLVVEGLATVEEMGVLEAAWDMLKAAFHTSSLAFR